MFRRADAELVVRDLEDPLDRLAFEHQFPDLPSFGKRTESGIILYDLKSVR